jgi:hypothetical protein
MDWLENVLVATIICPGCSQSKRVLHAIDPAARPFQAGDQRIKAAI